MSLLSKPIVDLQLEQKEGILSATRYVSATTTDGKRVLIARPGNGRNIVQDYEWDNKTKLGNITGGWVRKHNDVHLFSDKWNNFGGSYQTEVSDLVNGSDFKSKCKVAKARLSVTLADEIESIRKNYDHEQRKLWAKAETAVGMGSLGVVSGLNAAGAYFGAGLQYTGTAAVAAGLVAATIIGDELSARRDRYDNPAKRIASNLFAMGIGLAAFAGIGYGLGAGAAKITDKQHIANFDQKASVQTYAVDQLFRDHDGIRILRTDANGKVHEQKIRGSLYEYDTVPVKVEKELSNFKQNGLVTERSSYDIVRADVPQITVKEVRFSDGKIYHQFQLPADGKVSGGIESWGRHNQRKHSTIEEIK
jgi:hypothetical protein